jgi:hypothetical protein
MSESKDLLNAQFEMADAIREHTGHFVEEEVAICAIIGALDRALGADQFRVLQYMIQREDAPEDPMTWEDLPFRSRLIEVNSHPVYTVDEIMVGIPPIEEKPKSNDAGEQSTNSSKPWTEAEEQKLRSALAAIPTDEKILKEKFKDSHEVFYNIGRALERLGWGENGFRYLARLVRTKCRRIRRKRIAHVLGIIRPYA